MKRNTSDDEILGYAEYYIWWLLNCYSPFVPKEQIKREIDGVKDQLLNVRDRNTVIVELEILDEIESFEYDIVTYANMKNMERLLDEEFQRQIWL